MRKGTAIGILAVTVFAVIAIVVLRTGGPASTPVVTRVDRPLSTDAVPPTETAPGSGPVEGRSDTEAIRFSIEDLCDYELLRERERLLLEGDTDEESEAARYRAYLREIKDRLAVSGDAEHLHVAALLAEDASERIVLIERALALDQDNAIRVWTAVNICAAVVDEAGCPLREWSERLLALDSQNSEAWIRVAAIHYEAGDESAALEAMRQAAAASESRMYWPQTVAMSERALAAASDQLFVERATTAFGIAAAEPANYSSYLDMCRVQSEINTAWAQACLDYAEQSERMSETLIVQQIARHIQMNALTALGEDARLAAVKGRYTQAQQEQVNAGRDDLSFLLVSNPTLFSLYLDAIRQHGEADAQAVMRGQAIVWLRRHEDLECIP